MELYPTAKKAMTVFENFAGKQCGDQAKAAECIVALVSGEGMAGRLKGEVWRLPLGPDCIARLEGKIKSLSANLEKVREVGMSTDIVE